MKRVAAWIVLALMLRMAVRLIPGNWGLLVVGLPIVFFGVRGMVRKDLIAQVTETIRTICRNGDLRTCIMPMEDGVGETLLTLLPRDDSGKIVEEVSCLVVKSQGWMFKGTLHIKVLPYNGRAGTAMIVEYGPSEDELGYKSRIKAVYLAK